MPLADPRYLLILLPVAGLFHALRRPPHRVLLVLVASYAYYLTFPAWFLPILLGMTAFAYGAGLLVERLRETRWHWPVVAAVVLAALAPMVVFKVLSVAPADPWVYPVGLSFATFTAVAYLVDIALDVVDAERRPHRVAVATAFFPVVTLGPLLRTPVFPKLDFTRPRLTRQRVVDGLSGVIVGMALKVGVADVLARSSDAVYADAATASGPELFAGSAIELFQIYADWQAYSLIAVGSLRLFGVDLPPNFPQPYLSTTIGDFWRRWNVSLVNWFRDYVFTPVRLQLGTAWYAFPVAIFVTFTAFGAWHVRWEYWNYVVYGSVNGLLLIWSQATFGARDRLWTRVGVPTAVLTPARIGTTFFVVVLTVPLARATSLPEALHIYGTWVTFAGPAGPGPATPHIAWAQVLPLVAVLVAGDVVALWLRTHQRRAPVWLLVPVLVACAAVVTVHALTGEPTPPFVYFRF